jgi:DNA-binding CsgD family transcriptional regulator
MHGQGTLGESVLPGTGLGLTAADGARGPAAGEGAPAGMARDDAARKRADQCGHPQLTDREIEVLLLAAAGMQNRVIARSLGISVRTAEQHLETMLRRTGAKSRGELIARCFVAGILRTETWPPMWSGKHCLSIGRCACDTG